MSEIPIILDLSNSELEEIQNKNEQFLHRIFLRNIEYWYDAIENFTFRTKFVKIHKSDVQFFISAHEEYQKSGKLTVDNQEYFTKLSEKLKNAILSFTNGNENRKVFIKTSCRSPKDAVVGSENFVQVYQTNLIRDSKQDQQDLNWKMNCLTLTGMQALAFSAQTVEQYLHICIQSERIYSDMKIYSEYFGSKKKKYSHPRNFVIREWFDMDPMLEFRSFVSNSKITVMSQYHYFVYYPKLVKLAEELEVKIQSFFNEKISPKLDKIGLTKYCIDFVVIDGKVWVIELNGFEETTDSALFSWQNKEDRNLILNGPFEFRYRKTKPWMILSRLSKEWKEIIENN
ncbi:cell division cycle protein 123 [Anaeramoeba flamelloides]|uniref:Cell division cycle protein 123 n=1 Tax=Anaeramoeba flamelloides TaxID=1746091 RepID=A0AAV7Z495_9EUKA|nr:cell division cycle protein 123 [Anaeramoeba flamelloides]